MKNFFRPLGRSFAGVLLGAFLASPALAADFTEVALRKHDAGTFYIDGALKGYGNLRMLVDTGSSYLVVSQNILDELLKNGHARYARKLEGVMADGSSRVIPVYRLSALRIGDDCWVNDVEAAVLPGHTRPILGMNILSRLAPFTFSAEPARLSVQQCQGLVEASAPAEFTAVEAAAEQKTVVGVSQ